MKVTPTALPDVLILEPKVYGDDRGFFMESWNRARLGKPPASTSSLFRTITRARPGTFCAAFTTKW